MGETICFIGCFDHHDQLRAMLCMYFSVNEPFYITSMQSLQLSKNVPSNLNVFLVFLPLLTAPDPL